MKETRRIYLFFAVNILYSMAASFAHPVTPTIIQQRGFGDYMFGVALGTQLAVNFLFSPFWGRLVNYLSSRRIILFCSLGYAAGQAMFGLAGSEAMMVAARMFAGIFVGGVFTSLLTYIVNTSPETLRGQHLTVLATIQTVASAFGYFAGGMLGEIGVGVTMTAQVVLLAVGGVLFYLVCQDDAQTTLANVQPRALLREANPVAALLAGRQIMTPILACVFVISALANLGNNAFDQSFNYYLKAQLQLTSGYNGAIKAVIGLISLVTNGLIGMWLIKRTDIRRSTIYVYLGCAAATLGVVLLNSTVPFVITSVIYFGFFAISVPLTQSLAAVHARGGDSNLVMGFFNGLKALGGIFGALAAGLLYTANPKWPFLLGFAAFALSTLVSLRHYRLCQQQETGTAKSATVGV
ncbi:MAG: MFS transporter [Bacillota bacterium]|jgi:MFS family permease